MIFVTDALGRTVHASNEWTMLTGQSIQESLGFGWLDRVHPDDRTVVRETVEKAQATVSEFSVRYRVIRRNGEACWVAAGCVPSIGPPDFTFIGYLGSLTEFAPSTSVPMKAYGNVGRFVPPPSRAGSSLADNLDRIADHLILVHSLLEAEGLNVASAGVREALFQVGVAIADRARQATSFN